MVSEPVSEKFGTGKVSEPVSVKFGIGKKYRNRYRKNLVPKKVPVSVSKTFGTGKKYWYRYRQNLVPEKSIGIGIEDIWYRKKVSVSVSLKIMGTVTLCSNVILRDMLAVQYKDK